MKINSVFYYLIFSLYFLSSIDGQNIALNKPYKCSVSPNYENTASPLDKTSLTDGVFTDGYFWSKPTTVGWRDKAMIKISIDLLNDYNIDSIILSSAAGTAGVFFPKNIFIFFSEDNRSFEYVGDAADTVKPYGKYVKRKFILLCGDKRAKYVTLVIIPNGAFTFCDEIRITGGNPKFMSNDDNFFITNIETHLQKILVDEHRKASASKLDLLLPKNVVSWISKRNRRDNKDLNLENIGLSLVEYLKQSNNDPFIVMRQNPWDSLGLFILPSNIRDTLKYTLCAPLNGVQYGAFSITNTSNNVIVFDFDKIIDNPSVCDIDLYWTPFVSDKNDNNVADPLILIKESIKIDPGFTKLFIFRLKGQKSGKTTGFISVKSTIADKALLLSLEVKQTSIPIIDFCLNTNVWGYLNYSLLTGIEAKAVHDLQDHHVNTVVVHTKYIPGDITKTDFSRLDDYLGNFSYIENIILFMNYRYDDRRNGGYNGGVFMSRKWRKYFRIWHRNLLKSIKKNGYQNANVYLYPFDEPHSKVEIENYLSFIKWAKKSVPGIKFFSTFQNAEAIRILLPLVDVAQVSDYSNFLDSLPKAPNTKIWIYFSASSRAASPYRQYRLKAWEAYKNNYQGIGFWSYADGGQPPYEKNLINDSEVPPLNKHTVIYTDENKNIISSRRWEAFKLGIEDFEILKFYEKRFGYDKTNLFVNLVLTQPDKLDLADQVKSIMLKELDSISN